MFILKLHCKFKYSFLVYISKAAKSNVFTECIGVNTNKVEHFKKKYGLDDITEEQVRGVAKFCDEIGISSTQLKENPKLLKMNLRTLDSQYTLMNEIGFKNIDAFLLTTYRKCMNRPVSLLKAYDLIDENANVSENMLSHLKPAPVNIETSDITDNLVLFEIHRILLVRYLMWRFDATEDQIESFLRRKDSKGIRSFRFLCECIELAKDLDIAEKDMLQYGYILAGYPNYPLTAITECRTICGIKVAELYQRDPRLVTVHPKNMKAIKTILESYNVSKESLLGTLRILMLSPTTIKLRFEEIESIPELRVLKTSPRVLTLIAHHNRVRSRLSFLKSLNLNCSGFGILGDQGQTFEKHIRLGIDESSVYDVKRLLQTLLNADKKEFEKELTKHPYYLKVPLQQIEETFKYLEEKNFKIATIIKVVPILLYPKDKISRAFISIREQNCLKYSHLDEIQKLNLALYFMEKRHHFTGNGIWKNS